MSDPQVGIYSTLPPGPHTHASVAQGGQLGDSAFVDGALSGAKLTDGTLDLSTKIAAAMANARMKATRTSGTQALGAAAYTKVDFPTEEYDPGGNFDNGLGVSEYTTPFAGRFHVSAQVSIAQAAANWFCWINVYVDGVVAHRSEKHSYLSGGNLMPQIDVVLNLAAGKKITIYAYPSAALNLQGGDAVWLCITPLLV